MCYILQKHQDLAESACKGVHSPQALSLEIFCFTYFSVAQVSVPQSALSYQDLSTTHNQYKNKCNSPKCLKTEIWLFFSESHAGGLANHSPASPPRAQSAQKLALAWCNTQAGELSFNPQYLLAPKKHRPARHQEGASCGLEVPCNLSQCAGVGALPGKPQGGWRE